MARPVQNSFAQHLTPEARRLLDQAPDRHTRSQGLGFVGFLCREGIPLSEANDAHLGAFGAEVAALGGNRPKQAIRDSARAWNKLADSVPGWPQQRLVPPTSSRALLSFKDLPEEFRQDCLTYLSSRAEAGEDDLFSDTSADPWAAATVKDRRGKLCQLALHYVESGGRLSELKSLSDLFVGNAHKKILKRIESKTGGQKNGHAANLAHNMLIIAKHYVKAPQEVIDAIRNAKNKLRPGKIGMTAKNRSRLRALIQDKYLPRLLKLPSDFINTLDTSRPTLSDAVKVQSALAIQIVLLAPMRAKNLASLDIDEHFDFVSETQCHIEIKGVDVKNDSDLSYVLGPRFMRLYRLYVDIYLPLLRKGSNSSALFISRNGRVKSPAALGTQVQAFIKAQTGLYVNIHLFRHLAGYIFLLHNPAQYEPVRQLLGHKDLRTTTNFYTGLEDEAVFKSYSAILERLMTEIFDNEGDDNV
jgi:site-specific recombinase XerD